MPDGMLRRERFRYIVKVYSPTDKVYIIVAGFDVEAQAEREVKRLKRQGRDAYYSLNNRR